MRRTSYFFPRPDEDDYCASVGDIKNKNHSWTPPVRDNLGIGLSSPRFLRIKNQN
jgi:hypothetical protein